VTPESRDKLDHGWMREIEGAPRAALFDIGGNEHHMVNPPPGWKREEVRADGVSWYNAKKRLVVIVSLGLICLATSYSTPKTDQSKRNERGT